MDKNSVPLFKPVKYVKSVFLCRSAGERTPEEVPGDVGAPQQAPFWEPGFLRAHSSQQLTGSRRPAQVTYSSAHTPVYTRLGCEAYSVIPAFLCCRQGTASHDSYSEDMYKALLDSLHALEQEMKAVAVEWMECRKRIDDYVDEQVEHSDSFCF